MTIAAILAFALPGADSTARSAGAAEPRARTPGGQAQKDGPDDSFSPQDLVWLARNANRQGKYDEASRRARAAAGRAGAAADVLAAAWLNVFYAAHRSGDKSAASAALRSFDESATKLPVATRSRSR
jgi:hypothetical protein